MNIHIVSLRFENGNTATITVKERAGQPPVLNVEGLNYITKQSIESYPIKAS